MNVYKISLWNNVLLFWTELTCFFTRPCWMVLWPTWSSGRCPWPWQGSWNEMIFTVPSIPKYSIMILGLEIINPGSCSPKWTAVACDKWGWDLMTQMISLCCAFSVLLWHFFPQLQHAFPSVFFVLIKPLDPVKASRFSSNKYKYFPFSISC